MTNAHCRFCSRTDVTIDPRNDLLRWHKIPAGVDVGVPMTNPGDRCPGSSSDSYWRLDDPALPHPERSPMSVDESRREQTSPARRRIEYFAKFARPGATVEITEDPPVGGLIIAQLMVKGGIDTILVTVACREGKNRTRCSARYWFNSGGRGRTIPVGHISYRIRNQFLAS